MIALLRRAIARCILSLVVALGPGEARPYGVEDILRTEAFGKILVSPGGRWLVFERRIPLADATRFDLDALNEVRDRLYRVDLKHPAEARPLLPIAAGVGTVALAFSPDGSRLAIGRLEAAKWTLGIVTIASGAVRWFAIAPDYFEFRTTLQWASNRELVMIAQPPGIMPWVLRTNLQDAHELPRLWAAAQAGETPTVTAIGSGSDIELRAGVPATRLIALDVVSGIQRQLGEGDFQQLSVAPDGRHVAVISQAETIRVTTTGPIREEIDLRRRRLSIIDLVTGATWQPCAACDVPYALPLWSADGHRLLFYARHDGQRWTDGGPWTAEVAPQRATALALHGLAPVVIETSGDYDRPALAWSNGQPLLFARAPGTGQTRADWYRLGGDTPHNLTANVAKPTPRLVATARETPLMLTPHGPWRIGTRGSQQLPPRGDGVPAVVPGPGSGPDRQAWLAWRKRSGALVVTRSGDRARPYKIAGKGETAPVAMANAAIVATDTRPNGVETLLVAPRHAAAIPVATINRHLADLDPATPVVLHHRLPAGGIATSWLYQPRPRGDHIKPPLIAIPYPGDVHDETPPALWRPGRGPSYTNVQALVGHGYAVLVPSMPQLEPSNTAPFDFAGQLLAAVDAAIATGAVDPARLGLWGHSYGAYAAAVIATQTGRFAAIVASNGIYDLTSVHGAFAPRTRLTPGYGQSIIPQAGWTESEQPRLAATPWSNPDRYVANSPVYRAGRIVTPMLLITGDRDFAPLQQSEQLFAALYRQGKDAQLLTYWGEDHVLVSPANIRDCYARVFAWFDTHFAAAPASATARREPPPRSRQSARSIPAPSVPSAAP